MNDLAAQIEEDPNEIANESSEEEYEDNFEDNDAFEGAWIDAESIETPVQVENNKETKLFMKLLDMGFPQSKIAEAIRVGIRTEDEAIEFITSNYFIEGHEHKQENKFVFNRDEQLEKIWVQKENEKRLQLEEAERTRLREARERKEVHQRKVIEKLNELPMEIISMTLNYLAPKEVVKLVGTSLTNLEQTTAYYIPSMLSSRVFKWFYECYFPTMIKNMDISFEIQRYGEVMPVLRCHELFDNDYDNEYESFKLGDRSVVAMKDGVYEWKFKDNV